MEALRSRYLTRVAIFILVMAVPIFLITTNLRVIINSGWLYSFGFDRHDVAERTGIKKSALLGVATDIKAYFNATSDSPLDVRTIVLGQEEVLFNSREVRHMADVKGLVRGLFLWQRVTFIYIAAFTLVGVLLWGWRTLLRRMAMGLLLGGGFTFLLLVAAGLGSLVGFEALFEQFHFLSFSNDLWRLDPATDNLIRIFPEGFFLDATLIVVGLTLAQSALTVAVAGFYFWRRRGSQTPSSPLSTPSSAT